MPACKVLILYNPPVLPANHPEAISEHSLLDTVAAVQRSLHARGYQVSTVGMTYQPGLLVDAVRRYRPDAVFNLFEGTNEHGHTVACAAALLEWLGVPFTGCAFDTLCLARNKALTKNVLRGAGLPTPDFFVVERLPMPASRLAWPVIVKPNLHDASLGIDHSSVVTNQADLEARILHVQRTCGPEVLVEEFIAGREFTVPLVGT